MLFWVGSYMPSRLGTHDAKNKLKNFVSHPLSGLLIHWALTQGSASAAQPWALGQNPVGIPGGGCGKARPWGFPEGERRWPVLRRFHAHNGSSPASFPRPQRQRRCAIEPGVVRVAALPRVQAAARSLPRKRVVPFVPVGRCDIKGRNGIGFAGGDEESSRKDLQIYTQYHIPPVRSFGTTLSGGCETKLFTSCRQGQGVVA